VVFLDYGLSRIPSAPIKDPSGDTIAKVALTWKREGSKRGLLALLSVFESDPVKHLLSTTCGTNKAEAEITC
jgi:hypothetical protein